MKINKISLALAALGVVSIASVAQANTVIYLTGSTAARGNIYSAALLASGGIFSGAATVVSTGATSSSSQIVYEGTVSGITGTVDLDCSFSGSEAGIGAVAGVPLSQTLTSADDPNVPASPGTESFSLPNATPQFLTEASGWVTKAALGTGVNPDLTMADTSQAVSRTLPVGATQLVDYGIVAVVPFTWMKGYEASPDAPYNDLNNVTTAELNQAFADGFLLNANLFTGVPADAADGVAIIGRNLGSGTRVNCLLNAAQYGVTVAIQQYAYGTPAQLYPSATPGTLSFDGSYANATLSPVGNDGFDSGGVVQQELNTDGSGQGSVPIGYVGLSDGKNALAFNSATNSGIGGNPIPLPFNGVLEGDLAVENGDYTYWGSEHVLGQHGQAPSSNGGILGNAIYAGIHAQLLAAGAGAATGNIVSNHSQSTLIPTESMDVGRGNADSGYPVQGSF